MENNNIDTLLELYIQVTKLTDGNKQLDKNSFITLSSRYNECFHEKIEFSIHNNIEYFQKIKVKCDSYLSGNFTDVLEVLKNKFNEQHNKLQTSNNYSAIDYNEDSVIKEIFQNIFDQKFDDQIIIKLDFDDSTNKVTICYNEQGFDLKSLVFYFSAGDSAKSNEQTGKFGLGIKSVMYNVLSLDCKTVYENSEFSWSVKSFTSYENTLEIKKSLELTELKMKNVFNIDYKGTTLTIGLPKQMYEKIKDNFNRLKEGSNKYIDIPEIIFASKSAGSKDLTMYINNHEKYSVVHNGNEAKFNDLNFSFFNGQKDGYIKEILYFNNGNTNIFENCQSLYATYRMSEDKTMYNRSGSVFLSIKSDYVLSTRKALKNADTIKEKILDEAEDFICSLANVDNNKKLFTISINDELNVNYSLHLQKFMHLIKNPLKMQELFKNIDYPTKTNSGKMVSYYDHSKIAKVGHTRYSEKYKNQNTPIYESNLIGEHREINEKINILIKKVVLLPNENNNINVFIDMFNAKFDGNILDFNNIVVNVNGKSNKQISDLVKLVYAPKVEFYRTIVYGNNGSMCYQTQLSYFRLNSLKNLFENNQSYYGILATLGLENEYELNDCYKAIKIICDKKEVTDIDSASFELLRNTSLHNIFKKEIDIVKRSELEKKLKNNKSITFQDLLKYNDVIDITKVSIAKLFDFTGSTSFYNKFLPKNQERLEKIISANCQVEYFTEVNITNILKKSFYFNCDKEKGEYLIITDECNKIIKIENYTSFQEKLQNKNFQNLQLFYDLKNLIDDKNKFLWFTERKRTISEIEVYIDSFLKRLGNDEKKLKGFSAIANIKVKTLHTDQSPQSIKLVISLRKKSFCYLISEINEYLGDNNEDYKALIYRDFSAELYGNGYCCCVSDCDFDISNEYAYDFLDLIFQNYKLPIYVCQNHKMILSNTQIHINEITVGDKDINEIFNYLEQLLEPDYILPLYRTVKIKYTQKFNSDSFHPDMDSSKNNDETESNEDYAELNIKLSPVNLALWYSLNKNN